MKKKMFIPMMALGLTVAAFTSVAAAEENSHIIGVPVYDLADEQVQAFREYLESYIASSFEGVSFLYSQSIQTQEDEMAFIQSCIDAGAEGIMAFNSYDIEKEVELCASNNVYYMKPSSTVSSEDFAKVADNPYFIGYFGPGEEMEYQAGEDMGKWFAEQDFGKEYFILSGGASMGNVMHSERTRGILDALEAASGAKFDTPTTELAVAAEPITATAGDITIHVCAGYVGAEMFFNTAKEAYEANPSDVVLGVIPIAGMEDVIGDAKLGVIDCFSAHNSQLFSEGKLQYVCGKYSSIIGPAFAAMYNAVTGYAEDFKEEGRACAITQGFWVADDKEAYEERYALSSGIALNAYSYKDLLEVIKASNPDASFEDMKALAEAWDFQSALERTNS